MSMTQETQWSIQIKGQCVQRQRFDSKAKAVEALSRNRYEVERYGGTLDARVVRRVVNTIYGDWKVEE